MKFLIGPLVGLLLGAGFVWSQSADNIRPVNSYYITSFPLYGALVTPDDDNDLAVHGVVRANAAGAVTVICSKSSTSITLTLQAGEAVPCLVKRVMDTGTDAITLHVFP